MGKIEICIGLICLAVVGSNRGVDRGVVATSLPVGPLSPRGGERSVKFKTEGYEKVIRIATKEIGVRETGCENCGGAVEGYLAAVGVKENKPWCAAFVSHCFRKAGYAQPRTPWSPALFPASKVVKEPKPGIVFGLYYPALKRIAHCGIITRLQGGHVYTAEGNTSVAGSREGDGVYARIRHKRTIYRYADWVK